MAVSMALQYIHAHVMCASSVCPAVGTHGLTTLAVLAALSQGYLRCGMLRLSTLHMLASAGMSKASCKATEHGLTCLQVNNRLRFPSQASAFGHDTMVVELGLECQLCLSGMKASEL